MSAIQTLADLPNGFLTWATKQLAIAETSYETRMRKDYRQGIFEIKSSDLYQGKTLELGTIGTMELWPSGEAAPLTGYSELFPVTWVQESFGERLGLDRHAQLYYKSEVRDYSKLMKQIGYQSYLLMQKKAFALFKNGFSASFVHGYGDGKPVFSSLHPRSPQDSTSWSNVSTTSIALSEAGMAEAISVLDNTPNDRGEPLHLGENGYILIVTNTSDLATALRLFAPDAKDRPGTANRDVNVYDGNFFGRPIEIRWIPYVYNSTYPNAWFLIARDDSDLRVYQTEAFQTRMYDDPPTKSVFLEGSCSFKTALGSPKGIWASIGDGVTAYAL